MRGCCTAQKATCLACIVFLAVLLSADSSRKESAAGKLEVESAGGKLEVVHDNPNPAVQAWLPRYQPPHRRGWASPQHERPRVRGAGLSSAPGQSGFGGRIGTPANAHLIYGQTASGTIPASVSAPPSTAINWLSPGQRLQRPPSLASGACFLGGTSLLALPIGLVFLWLTTPCTIGLQYLSEVVAAALVFLLNVWFLQGRPTDEACVIMAAATVDPFKEFEGRPRWRWAMEALTRDTDAMDCTEGRASAATSTLKRHHDEELERPAKLRRKN